VLASTVPVPMGRSRPWWTLVLARVDTGEIRARPVVAAGASGRPTARS